MLARLEKRWKDCDQPVFITALILNPFEKLSCFGPSANLNQFKSLNLMISLYRRMKGRLGNTDTPEERNAKETKVSEAFMQYLSGTGDFADFDAETWEQTYVWEALAGSRHLTELAEFAIVILNIVANQASCERTFSRTKIEQSDHRNRLGLPKIDKRTKRTAPRSCFEPRRRRTQLAKWIGDAKEAEHANQDSDTETDTNEDGGLTPRIPNRLPAWKPITLKVLFGGVEKPRARKPSMRVEERWMEQMANFM
ncbi:hypothetical protein FB451DRAFT_1170127 [Mycena latifolia]|nr:hypothetical protein FB451DRAFT_1170127 [Mycena latifolia]